MAKELQYRRLCALALLLAAAFAGLGYRLVDLQVLRHDTLAKVARDETHHVYSLEAKRGDILDSKMQLLATSVFVKTVCADPVAVCGRQAEVARTLAPLLRMNEGEIVQRLTPRIWVNEKGQSVTNRYVVLKKKTTPEEWQKIHDAMSQFEKTADEKKLPKAELAIRASIRDKAIFTDQFDDQLRSYPNGPLAAQVLGFVGTVNHTNNGTVTSETAGIDGIERSLNDQLKGVRGWRATEIDGRKQELVAWREQNVEPHDGLNVVLTIDSVIQHIAQTALLAGMQKSGPTNASCIVVRPQTGEILAMLTLPDFDANHLETSTPESRRLRAVADQNEPGSTFKVVVISSAFDDGITTPTEIFKCGHGVFWYAGRWLHDHVPLDDLTVEQVIAKSSNIGAAQIGIRMGPERLYQHLLDFGFNAPTGIPLPAESAGQVNPLRDWSKVSVAQIPMGQGVAVTSLQMAMAMSAIANKGVLMRPMLVKQLVDSDGNVVTRYNPERVRRVIGEKADREIIAALKMVPTSEGTAPQAAMAHYKVAGKTGTAQKPPYALEKYYASFIGFFPADDPAICIYVSMDEPKVRLHQGGQVAAPIFKEIAEKVASYLNIPPDDGAGPLLPGTAAAARPAVLGQIQATRAP